MWTRLVTMCSDRPVRLLALARCVVVLISVWKRLTLQPERMRRSMVVRCLRFTLALM